MDRCFPLNMRFETLLLNKASRSTSYAIELWAVQPDHVPNSLARYTHVCYTSNGVPVGLVSQK